MTTVLYLHGGNTALTEGKNVKFFRNPLDDVNESKVTICHIPYAALNKKNPMNDMDYLEGNINNFDITRNFGFMNPHKRIRNIVAPYPRAGTKSVDNLRDKIVLSDILFVWGGDGDYLQALIGNVLPQGDLAGLVKDKVIMGVSAGTNMWALKYYSNDNKKVMDGLKIFPIATFCHYHSSKYPQLNTLVQNLDYAIPVIPIAENDFVRLEL